MVRPLILRSGLRFSTLYQLTNYLKMIPYLNATIGIAMLFVALYAIWDFKKQKKLLTEIQLENEKLNQLLLKEREIKNELSLLNSQVFEKIKLQNQEMAAKEFRTLANLEKLKTITGDITKLIELDDLIRPNQLLFVEKRLKTIMEDDVVWENFKVQFEKTKPDFYKNLRNQCSSLTDKELKYCSFFASRMGNKDIAKVLGISYRSVEMARYRLRKKLNLHSEKGLYEFLEAC